MNIRKRASITLEAALAFPLFFFACMALCYLFVFMKTEYTVQRGMFLAARSVSSYGAIVEPMAEYKNSAFDSLEEKLPFAEKNEVKELLSGLAERVTGFDDISLEGVLTGAADRVIVKGLVETQLPDEIYRYIDGGISGMDFIGSVLFTRQKCIDIVCSYKLKLPGDTFTGIRIPVKQKLTYRYFCGTETKSLLVEEEQEETPKEEPVEDEEIVLITDTGYCYHRSYSCPNLNIRPKQAMTDEVDKLRNDGGAKYYECEFCVKKKKKQQECYITPEGDRYHFDKKCQGLKRTIYEVKISEVGKKRACKRCAKDKE